MQKKKVFWTMIFIIYILWIFSNSLDVADASSAKSSAVQMFINQILFGGRPLLTEHIIRKLAHFSEYGLAGILGSVCFKLWGKAKKYQIMETLFVGIMVALCDETIQLFVPGRSGQLSDVWIDFGGYTLGMTVTMGYCAVRYGVKRLLLKRNRSSCDYEI